MKMWLFALVAAGAFAYVVHDRAQQKAVLEGLRTHQPVVGMNAVQLERVLGEPQLKKRRQTMLGAEEVWTFASGTVVALNRGKVSRIEMEESKSPAPGTENSPQLFTRDAPQRRAADEDSAYSKSATDMRKQWGWESRGSLDQPARR